MNLMAAPEVCASLRSGDYKIVNVSIEPPGYLTHKVGRFDMGTGISLNWLRCGVTGVVWVSLG
jgi:hypothetical protein